MARVRLFCGPQRSPRTRKLDEIMHRHWGRAILLAPTRHYARRRAEQLLLECGMAGAWGSPVQTFEEFADSLHKDAGVESRRLTEFERRLVLQRAVARLRGEGRLDALGAAVDTEGFLSHVQRVIEQLKQAAVDPADFPVLAAGRRHPSSVDGVVAEVYTAYQDALIAGGLHDRIGLYWQAHQLLDTGRAPGMLNDIQVLILDGFDDFTPSEFRLIRSLEPHLESLVFGLRLDIEQPARADLYAVQRRTHGRILREWPHLDHVDLASERPSTLVEFAADYMLWRDALPSADAMRRNIVVTPCPGAMREVEIIGRRIKSLVLEEDVPVGEIAVVYRDLSGMAATIRSVFGEYGIPVRVHNEPSLRDSSVCSFVMTLLESTVKWAHSDIVSILASPWCRPADACDPAFADAVPILARVAGVVSGAAQWESRVEWLIERLGADDEFENSPVSVLKKRMPEANEAAADLLARVRFLRDLAARVPAKATSGEYARVVCELIDCCGIPTAIAAQADELVRMRERAALDALRDVLGRLELWDGCGGAVVPRADFIATLRQAFAANTFREPGPRHGVACLDAQSIRYLRFDHVFFAGVNEGEIPRPPGANAIYSEGDIHDFDAAGIALETRQTRGERELLWFHHVIEAARKRLWISWRTITTDGKPMLRSPFLNDLLHLFGDMGIEEHPRALSEYYPAIHEAASLRDLRNACFATGSPMRGDFARADAGARIELDRMSSAPFGRHDGVIGDSELKDGLICRFGGGHTFSAAQIEDYLCCPFRFLGLRVLDIKTVDEPEDDLDRRDFGSIIHGVLERFHQRYQGKALFEVPEDEALASMRELLAAELDRRSGLAAMTHRGVFEVEKACMAQMLERYLSLERDEADARWKPMRFELAFGVGGSGKRKAGDTPFSVETENGPVLMSGRIDRVDEDGELCRVVDYKTGAVPAAKDVLEGLSIQLAVYALALENDLLPGRKCSEGLIMRVGAADKRRCGEAARVPGWDDVKKAGLGGIARAVEGMRAADFPPVPLREVCGHCELRPVCRKDASRIERKKVDS